MHRNVQYFEVDAAQEWPFTSGGGVGGVAGDGEGGVETASWANSERVRYGDVTALILTVFVDSPRYFLGLCCC